VTGRSEPARPTLPPIVVKAVLEAYYPSALAAGDRVRTRAVNGFTVASAIGAGLVAAGLASGLGSLGGGLEAVGFIAVILWLAAAAAYLWAVSWRVKAAPRPEAKTEEDLANNRLSRADEEVDGLTPRIQTAFWLTLGALVATVVVIALAVFARPDPRHSATVLLTRWGAREFRQVCGEERFVVRARVDPSQLQGRFIPLSIIAPECGRHERDVDLSAALIIEVVFDKNG
jgi:hypothetical protein